MLSTNKYRIYLNLAIFCNNLSIITYWTYKTITAQKNIFQVMTFIFTLLLIVILVVLFIPTIKKSIQNASFNDKYTKYGELIEIFDEYSEEKQKMIKENYLSIESQNRKKIYHQVIINNICIFTMSGVYLLTNNAIMTILAFIYLCIGTVSLILNYCIYKNIIYSNETINKNYKKNKKTNKNEIVNIKIENKIKKDEDIQNCLEKIKEVNQQTKGLFEDELKLVQNHLVNIEGKLSVLDEQLLNIFEETEISYLKFKETVQNSKKIIINNVEHILILISVYKNSYVDISTEVGFLECINGIKKDIEIIESIDKRYNDLLIELCKSSKSEDKGQIEELDELISTVKLYDK